MAHGKTVEHGDQWFWRRSNIVVNFIHKAIMFNGDSSMPIKQQQYSMSKGEWVSGNFLQHVYDDAVEIIKTLALWNVRTCSLSVKRPISRCLL